MVDKSKLAIATSQIQNPIPFLIELLFNLLSQMITISTIKLTCHPVRAYTFGIGRASIYRWLSRPKLSATKVKSRQIKLDWKELKKRCKTKSRVEHCQTELKNLELINQLYFML